jgi:hypothetical protein
MAIEDWLRASEHGPGVLRALQRRQTCILTLSSVVTFPISSSPITGGSP